MNKYLSHVFSACFACLILPIVAHANEFSFTSHMAELSGYEQEIARGSALNRDKQLSLRQSLVAILSESESRLAELDAQIDQKRERLTALLETSSSENDVSETMEAEIELTSGVQSIVDPVLLRNKESLEIELITLETAHKKAALVKVYADDLIVQLDTSVIEQSQQQLLFQAPSLFSLENWNRAYKSIAPVISIVSGDIVRWVLMVSSVGLLLIFAIGPFLYRSFDKNYKQMLPVKHFPRWSFFAIFLVALVANCFYFVFITKEQHIELAFLIILLLNLTLAALIIKRLHGIKFASKVTIVDGEKVIQDRHWLSFFISVIKLLTLSAALASLFGYVVLGMYVLHNIVITLTAAALFLSLRGLWISSEKSFIDQANKDHANENTINDKVQTKRQSSLFLLTIVELCLAASMFVIAARFWGLSLNNFKGHSSIMSGELQLGSLSVSVSQLLASIAVFVLVLYFFKLIHWFLRERVFKVMNLSLSSSEAVLAIFGYMGFTFAIVASLNALGVQWQNLAIIAGALSVGIGFGLQTIISNFVSGLILLFERPVRVGDWVILGNGLEGHIKKINMRSTEIMTLERSSVLIPNSNLLSDTITNWTLHDKMGRQDIAIGVAYGSDTQTVKKVLLEVASAHKLLRRYPQPQVLFQDFGDSSLDFTLRVFLKNIDDRHRVSSDLRYDIDSAFREYNITIPFPQRDLHIIRQGDEPSTQEFEGEFPEGDASK